MERMLLKMAKQLNEYDEASLLALWERYARLVQEFEPSRRWEEAALVFSFIQAVRLKNQLFNKHLAQSANPEGGHLQEGLVRELSAWAGKERGKDVKTPKKLEPSGIQKRCKVLHFRRRKGDKPV